MVLWWDTDLDKLSKVQHEAIGNPDNQVFVSSVTGWELGIKRAAGKLVLSDSIRTLIRRFGFIELPITVEHGESAASLPLLHSDPFDRMLVAQALIEELTLVTADATIRNTE
ncbi:MAG: PilT protein putative toxin of system [Acidobacteriaceae bacterium]|nr:PilT protein putative toxin of system [Acidobacteriaceae bacterium]